MAVQLDPARFELGHQAFLTYVRTEGGKRPQGGTPFTSFEHDFLQKDEIRYKHRAVHEAYEVLQLDRWPRWRNQAGRILHAVQAACSPKISRNLLEHRYGPARPFARARTPAVRRRFEAALFDLFTGDSSPTAFAPRFDAFASFLREERLGCAWPFVAYLAFLVSPQHYFPIRPSRFQKLLHFYRIDAPKLTGHVSWDRYLLLLDLGDALRDRLLRYGRATAIAIQSYMWVVSSRIDDHDLQRTTAVPPVDFEDELKRREAAAKERERIGLAGEEFVYDEEKRKLERAGRPDLAKRVAVVALGSDERGYDVRSFDPIGHELHIEVKATTSDPKRDQGFWLSDAEKRIAEQDSAWRLYRVWEIDLNPHCEDLGNVVTSGDAGWELLPSTWFVRKTEPPAAH